MSFEPPAGILDIGNATLRVGKLEVTETTGLNQGLQNIVKNDLLLTETAEYSSNKHWGLKLPTTWVAEFEVKGETDKYVEFNFYNEGSTSNAYGYTLNFRNTTLTLKFDENELSPGYPGSPATIPTIVGTFRKVNVFLERGVIAVYIDGARVLYYKFGDGYNANLGVPERVISTTGSAFLNLFIEDNSDSSLVAFKNLRIVNGRFISDKTSNVSFIGSLGVGVHSPKESLDIRGNMHLNRVSNVSQVSVDSNVVTEYTGPHDRPLRKYPEVALTQNDESSTSGYVASASHPGADEEPYYPFKAFDGDSTTHYHSPYPNVKYNSSGIYTGDHKITDVDNVDHDGEWIKIQLPNAIKVEYMKFMARTSYQNRFPNKISILGSNDDSNWHLFLRDDNVPLLPVNPTFHTIPINATTKYKYYALVIREISHSAAPDDNAQVSQWELYGYEEGDASLDTTLKSVYNVPATTGAQLEVYYDGQDYSEVTSAVTDKAGTDTNATITNTGSTITFNDEYKAWTFGGTDPGPGVESTRTDTFIATMPSSFSGNQVHSVSTWFRYEQTFGDDAIFSISPSSGEDTNKSIGVRLNGGVGENYEIRYYHWGNDLLVNFPRGHTANTWYHMVVTYTGSITDERRGKSVYINGELCPFASETTTGELNLDGGDQLQLARRNDGAKEFFGSIANFRIYTKCLNADQIKELYDYQKDYFLGSKSQLTLYKGHLGVGVTEPSGQLELAGDERVQEYPPRAITVLNYHTHIEGHGEFEFYSSQSDSGYFGTTTWDFTSVFENTERTGGGWHGDGSGGAPGTYQAVLQYAPAVTSGAGLRQSTLKNGSAVFGEWIEMRSPYAINVTSLATVPRTNYGNSRGIGKFVILGSNNGIDWEYAGNGAIAPYDTSSSTDAGGYGTRTSELIAHVSTNSNGYYYTYHRLVVTHLMGHRGASGHPQFSSGATEVVNQSYIRFYGTPSPTTLDKGSLTLGRSLDVPRVSRYDADTETPRPEKLIVDYDTTVNSSPIDISGKGSHGTFVGDASYSEANKAFNFTGASTNDMIVAYIPTSSGDNTLSVSFWYKRTSTSGTHCPVRIGDPSSGQAIAMDIYSAGTVYWFIFSGKNFSWTGVTDTWFPLNTWTHVVCVHTAGTDFANLNEVYINGVPQSSTATFGGSTDLSLDAAADTLVLGARSTGTNHAIGQISNFKIYSITLERSEVKKLYNMGQTGRSMVISDTAVGIGKAPEAQLDVRGNIAARGAISSNNPGWSYWKTGTTDQNDIIYNSATDGPVTFESLQSFGQNWETGVAGGSGSRGTGRNFEPSTGTYTAPEKGVYLVQFCWSINGGSGGDDSQYVAFVTGGNADNGGSWESGGSFPNRASNSSAYMKFNPEFSTRSGIEECWCMSDLVLLDKGSTVQVWFKNVSTHTTLVLNSANFSGIKIA